MPYSGYKMRVWRAGINATAKCLRRPILLTFTAHRWLCDSIASILGTLWKGPWDGWNTWFIAEAKRRPLFGWTGNRKHFADEFLQHVDRELLKEGAP